MPAITNVLSNITRRITIVILADNPSALVSIESKDVAAWRCYDCCGFGACNMQHCAVSVHQGRYSTWLTDQSLTATVSFDKITTRQSRDVASVYYTSYSATFVRHSYLHPLAEMPWSQSCLISTGRHHGLMCQHLHLSSEGHVDTTGQLYRLHLQSSGPPWWGSLRICCTVKSELPPAGSLSVYTFLWHLFLAITCKHDAIYETRSRFKYHIPTTPEERATAICSMQSIFGEVWTSGSRDWLQQTDRQTTDMLINLNTLLPWNTTHSIPHLRWAWAMTNILIKHLLKT